MSNKEKPSITGIVFGSLSFVAWVIPVIGIPIAILSIVFNALSKHPIRGLFIFFGVLSLIASGVNAYVGYDLSVKASENEQRVQQEAAKKEEEYKRQDDIRRTNNDLNRQSCIDEVNTRFRNATSITTLSLEEAKYLTNLMDDQIDECYRRYPQT